MGSARPLAGLETHADTLEALNSLASFLRDQGKPRSPEPGDREPRGDGAKTPDELVAA